MGKHLRFFDDLASWARGLCIDSLGVDARRAGSKSIAAVRIDAAHEYVFAREHSASGLQYVDAGRIWTIS